VTQLNREVNFLAQANRGDRVTSQHHYLKQQVSRMSTQTGISANSDLAAFFAKARQEKTKAKYRMIKVLISNEELVKDEHRESGSSWERDWDLMVAKSVEGDQPCFILFRTDEMDDSGSYRWLLISWSPDSASVRNKMLYASTKATLKKDFGSGHISDDYYANSIEEVTLSGYKRHLASEKAPQPLTRAEEELAEVRASEMKTEISIETKHQTVGGLSFPLTKSAISAITEFRVDQDLNYVQLAIDIQKEVVDVTKSEKKLSIQELPSCVPNDVPRYHLYRFNHHYEGAQFNTILFIYSMPGYECSIKERMLYSSCRNALVQLIGQHHSVTVEKKMEVDSGSELTEDNILNEIHPKKESSANANKMTRPAPPSRGKRRMTRVPPSASTS